MEVVETKTETKERVDVPERKHELPFRLTVDDLLLLVDFFYLPHQHGKQALQILNDFRWLKANSIKTEELSDEESAEKVLLKAAWFPLRKTFLRTGTDRKVFFVL